MQPFVGSPGEWNQLIADLPNPHLLQTSEWAQVKAGNGWQALPLTWKGAAGEVRAAAMVLKRSLGGSPLLRRLSILYAPKGPLLDWSNAELRAEVLDDLQAFARAQDAIFLKIDPDVPVGTGIPGEPEAADLRTGLEIQAMLPQRGWDFSSDQVQFRNTVLIDLTSPEEEMLTRMKQKTRYNIRLSGKKGITVRPGTLEDLTRLYTMYAETSMRDGFVIREEAYYQNVWRTFMANPLSSSQHQPACEPLIAVLEGEVLAAVTLFYFAGRAYYLFGMSRAEHREKMPNYLLQWEAMRRAKSLGCSTYNLWGAPDEFNAQDGLWGVFRFKEGLGGKVVRTLGAWDFASRPAFYRAYTQILPRILDLMRSRGKARTRQSIGA
jgi:lipid II:glycine glycyltransferase (peptidoglycan interpeptide bridge formation enzyme)